MTPKVSPWVQRAEASTLAAKSFDPYSPKEKVMQSFFIPTQGYDHPEDEVFAPECQNSVCEDCGLPLLESTLCLACDYGIEDPKN